LITDIGFGMKIYKNKSLINLEKYIIPSTGSRLLHNTGDDHYFVASRKKSIRNYRNMIPV